VSEQLRGIAKRLIHLVAVAIVSPSLASFALRSRVLGADRALEGSTQLWACVPGLVGQYLRRAFLMHAIAYCAPSAVIEFGTLFSSVRTRIDDRAYVGPRCHLGWVHLECDVLLAAGVHVPSGAETHGTASLTVPIREQPGVKRQVRIGSGSWIGSAAIVMADVGRDTIVGAGAVVTRALPDRVVAGGVPARVLRYRDPVLASVSG
jgi:acetyltransferase-like isoleucine patch superfamily enzyme